MKFKVKKGNKWIGINASDPLSAIEKVYNYSPVVWSFALRKDGNEYFWVYEPDVSEEWAFIPDVKAADKAAINLWKKEAKKFGFYEWEGKELKKKKLTESFYRKNLKMKDILFGD